MGRDDQRLAARPAAASASVTWRGRRRVEMRGRLVGQQQVGTRINARRAPARAAPPRRPTGRRRPRRARARVRLRHAVQRGEAQRSRHRRARRRRARPSATLACTVPAKICGFWPIQAMRCAQRRGAVLAEAARRRSRCCRPARAAGPRSGPAASICRRRWPRAIATCSPGATCKSKPSKTGRLARDAETQALNVHRRGARAVVPGNDKAGDSLRPRPPGKATPSAARRSSASSAASPAARSCQTAASSRSGSKKAGASSRMKKPCAQGEPAAPGAENQAGPADESRHRPPPSPRPAPRTVRAPPTTERRCAAPPWCAARSACAASRRRSAVASTASSARSVASPRRRSSRKAFIPPISTICASLAALARQPTSAMKNGISGAANNSTSAATQDSGSTASRITGGTTVGAQPGRLVARPVGHHRLGLLRHDAGGQARGRARAVQRRARRQRVRDLRAQARQTAARRPERTPRAPCIAQRARQAEKQDPNGRQLHGAASRHPATGLARPRPASRPAAATAGKPLFAAGCPRQSARRARASAYSRLSCATKSAALCDLADRADALAAAPDVLPGLGLAPRRRRSSSCSGRSRAGCPGPGRPRGCSAPGSCRARR